MSVSNHGYGNKVSCKYLDATNRENLKGLFAEIPDVVIDLLPVPFIDDVAINAVERNCHLVNTFYTSPKIRELEEQARNKNIAIQKNQKTLINLNIKFSFHYFLLLFLSSKYLL